MTGRRLSCWACGPHPFLQREARSFIGIEHPFRQPPWGLSLSSSPWLRSTVRPRMGSLASAPGEALVACARVRECHPTCGQRTP